MKALSIILISFMILFGCASEEKQDLTEQEAIKNEPHIGRVIEKIPAKGYTYLQVTENKKDFWIAVPTMEIEVGETVYFSRFMIMEDFRSDNIDKSFDEILFVEDARKSPTPDEMKKIHSGVLSGEKQDIKIEPLSDGKTIQQIFSSKSTLNGELVKVKGKVVKFNKQIMKRNWIHIQDGTGSENEFDLVITSDDEVKVGDIITAEGKIAVDKDFGAGYFFPVIIEDAKIEKEL
ncbi:MAG: SH3-like domain-containing protein [Ignavibacteriaceae bacterium]|nr:SH3-like domain-containing protein [Ignavibacteriaceae bacterium]